MCARDRSERTGGRLATRVLASEQGAADSGLASGLLHHAGALGLGSRGVFFEGIVAYRLDAGSLKARGLPI